MLLARYAICFSAKIQITEFTPPSKQAEADLPADNDTDKSKLSPPKAKRLKKSSSSSNVKMSNGKNAN